MKYGLKVSLKGEMKRKDEMDPKGLFHYNEQNVRKVQRLLDPKNALYRSTSVSAFVKPLRVPSTPNLVREILNNKKNEPPA